MARHSGKALWFSKSTNEFVTSSYYYEKYPQWVVDWNAKKLPEQYSGTAWELMHPQDTYLFGDRDNQDWEFDLDGYRRTFPHQFSTTDNKYFSTYLTVAPLVTSYVNFARGCHRSRTDWQRRYYRLPWRQLFGDRSLGHFFGPSTWSRRQYLRLDRTLANLSPFSTRKLALIIP